MSGIVGYWAYSSQDLAEADFAGFTHSLAHRGPDGFGIEHFPEARLWLGHRRLAIVDLSERARQPMSYAEGRYWLTYNGEVYNYLELREELRGLGHRFVSESDSEVILAAYAQWGQECQLRFNGMWAFAIWDAHERRLFLSRDRFRCQAAALQRSCWRLRLRLRAQGVSHTALDRRRLRSGDSRRDAYQRQRAGGPPYTLLPGVRRLPAGHAMLVEADGRVQINAWWNTLDHLPQPGVGLEEQAEEFRALFFDACRLRLRSDVPLATALSGGLELERHRLYLAELGRRGASIMPRKTGNAPSWPALSTLPTMNGNIRKKLSTYRHGHAITMTSMTTGAQYIEKVHIRSRNNPLGFPMWRAGRSIVHAARRRSRCASTGMAGTS